jgi:hypothetical protein
MMISLYPKLERRNHHSENSHQKPFLKSLVLAKGKGNKMIDYKMDTFFSFVKSLQKNP